MRHLFFYLPFYIQACASFVTLESLAVPCLKLISEHMYPQILPTLSPHLTHRLQIGNVGDLLAHALFDQPREDIGCAGPARDVS